MPNPEARPPAARRRVLATLAALPVLFSPVPRAARAETLAEPFPQRSVRLLVPFPPGQAADIAARLLADQLSRRWGPGAVVDNRPGAGGAIGMEAAARAPADGHTLLYASSGPTVILPAVSDRLSYDPLRDFIPVARVLDTPLMLTASTNSGFRTLADLLARARATEVNYGSGGFASTQHMAGALLAAKAGLKLNHIPYRGSAQALADIVAGNIPVMVDSVASSLPMIREGRAVALALCGPTREPALPGIPTIAEAGVPGYEAVAWGGVMLPAGTPPALAATLSDTVLAILADPAVQARIRETGQTPSPGPAAEFGRFVAAELTKWREVARAANIRLE
ncbi:tripartite tricarboxylate transporter substrate-binding protein [Roseomonas sp. NAR14]|uniref:Tripartite tricarboxylate transporter substrate-binding protein n=1 Tax=Roseomonas acroporae TaxID=2937791 RepID=A0A9X1Y9U9_9PROT|nr:tripartite tricarboxylate transporter substrate-binding protein [Roseomonas acroporae]MCK8785060.1 tripartite tricarboxylate transporter substrate-binding protein [Roseomonas acroporae]